MGGGHVGGIHGTVLFLQFMLVVDNCRKKLMMVIEYKLKNTLGQKYLF